MGYHSELAAEHPAFYCQRGAAQPKQRPTAPATLIDVSNEAIREVAKYQIACARGDGRMPLVRMIERAEWMLTAGVLRRQAGNAYLLGSSQDDEAVYLVRPTSTGYRCECQAATRGLNCWHCQAASLLEVAAIKAAEIAQHPDMPFMCEECEGEGWLISSNGCGDQAGGWADTCQACGGTGSRVIDR